MDLLGPSLWDVWNSSGQAMDATYVACVAVEAIYILKELHAKGWAFLYATVYCNCEDQQQHPDLTKV